MSGIHIMREKRTTPLLEKVTAAVLSTTLAVGLTYVTRAMGEEVRQNPCHQTADGHISCLAATAWGYVGVTGFLALSSVGASLYSWSSVFCGFEIAWMHSEDKKSLLAKDKDTDTESGLGEEMNDKKSAPVAQEEVDEGLAP